MGIDANMIKQAAEILDSRPCLSEVWKACKRCGEVKPLDEFYRHPGTRDGHLGICKICKILIVNKSPYKAKKTQAEKARQSDLKVIRKGLPRDYMPRTCGFYNPKDRVIWEYADLVGVSSLWAAVIHGARKGMGKYCPPNPHFFKQKDGVFAWLKEHVGVGDADNSTTGKHCL